jgi:hypothetical protein
MQTQTHTPVQQSQSQSQSLSVTCVYDVSLWHVIMMTRVVGVRLQRDVEDLF